jgi:bifunctional non-homologous end joining protein LigD
VRARAGAPVALPIEWAELKALEASSQFTMKDVLQRIDAKGAKAMARPKGQALP